MTKPCVIGLYCSEHGFVHGAEAEELRKGIGKLLSEEQDGDNCIAARALQRVLDTVDARDSLAFAEFEKQEGPDSHELVEDEKDHVDTFVDNGTRPFKRDEWYARWVLLFMRFPAAWQLAFAEFFGDRKLYCTYNGDRYRVTMASRFGDIGLAPARAPESSGYEHRVLVKECSDWSDKP